MKKLAMIPALMILAVLAVSGCTQLDGIFPKDTIYTLEVPVEGTGDVSDCNAEFRSKYPEFKNFDCLIKATDIIGGKIHCECTVHTGVI